MRRTFEERERFEPSVPHGTHDFQSCPFGDILIGGHSLALLARCPPRPRSLRRREFACARHETHFRGERAIRTLGTSRYTRFPIVPLRRHFNRGAFARFARSVPPAPPLAPAEGIRLRSP